MWAYGSLFLDQLKREGRLLCWSGPGVERLEILLESLPKFRRAQEDFVALQAAFRTYSESAITCPRPDLDLWALAEIARSAAILGAYCIGEPTYGREAPFLTVGRRLGYSDVRVAYLSSRATLFRRTPVGDDGWSQLVVGAIPWVVELEQLLEDLRVVVGAYVEERPVGGRGSDAVPGHNDGPGSRQDARVQLSAGDPRSDSEGGLSPASN